MNVSSRLAISIFLGLALNLTGPAASAEGLQFMVGGQIRAFDVRPGLNGLVLSLTNLNTKVTTPIRLPGFKASSRVLVKPNFKADVNPQILVFDPSNFDRHTEIVVAYLDQPERTARLTVPFKVADLTYLRENGKTVVLAGTPDGHFYKIDTQFSEWKALGSLEREGRGEFLSFAHFEPGVVSRRDREGIPLIFKHGLGMLEMPNSMVTFRHARYSPSSDWKTGARTSPGDPDWGGLEVTVWGAQGAQTGSSYNFIAGWGIDLAKSSRPDVLDLGPAEFLTLAAPAYSEGHCIYLLTQRSQL